MNMEIKVQHVGRIDSILHDLSRFEINSKSKITMEVALDVIDCYRRGGNSIVGLASVVHRDIKEGVIALGNPARPIKNNENLRVFS